MNQVKKVTPLFFMLAMLILATGLNSLSQVDHTAYQNKTDLIRNINEQASQLSLAVFLVAEGETTNYDQVTLVKRDLTSLTEQLVLNTPPSNTLYQSTLNLMDQVEQIKSTHAIYRNSLIFFPTARTRHRNTE